MQMTSDLFGDTEQTKKSAVCGKCFHFDKAKEAHNFAPCKIDAFCDGLVLHKAYKSGCPEYKK